MGGSIGSMIQYLGARPHIVAGLIGEGESPTLANNEKKKEQKSMVKEFREDMRSFMREHKSIIYWAIILYVVDHYCFEGALKARLQKMVQNLVGKVEAKLDQAKI